ncbi:MAG: hypothetical protein SFX18_15745 [Pirellulales bacterium]|nr:hypothetical protein [Pirellulales bacterium]
MRLLTFVVLAVGLLCVLISLFLMGLSALGYLGVLADVGPAENEKMGKQLLSLGIPPLIGGLVLCGLGLLASAWNRRRADTQTDSVDLK